MVDRFVSVGEYFIAGSGYAVSAHEVLCVCLAALYSGGCGRRSETRYALCPKYIGKSHGKWVVGYDRRKIYRVLLRKFDYSLYVGRLYVHAFSLTCYASVSGETI